MNPTRKPYAVTVTAILYTEAETEDHAADHIEDELGAILPPRAIWRVEGVGSDDARAPSKHMIGRRAISRGDAAPTRQLTATERAVLRGMLP